MEFDHAHLYLTCFTANFAVRASLRCGSSSCFGLAPLFQQLIAKASDDVKRKLEWEGPDLVGQIQTLVTDVTGALQSKFGPASMSYFNAKKMVVAQHQRCDLDESNILEYARSHKFHHMTHCSPLRRRLLTTTPARRFFNAPRPGAPRGHETIFHGRRSCPETKVPYPPR
jgi:hypothetical protein